MVDLHSPAPQQQRLHTIALEARQTSSTLYNDDQQSRSSKTEEEMNRYRMRESQASMPSVGPKKSRRKRRDVNPNALLELDETVASVGSHNRGASWNDGDSFSQSSQSIATHEGHSTHRSLIANMRDVKDMRGRSLQNPYVVGPRSVVSRQSMGSRHSRLSRRSATRNKRDALERMIHRTLFETATLEEEEPHFLPSTLSETVSISSVLTTDDILNDLVQVSTIVQHEVRSRSPPQEGVSRHPKPLLHPNASGDSGDVSYDNVDYEAPSHRSIKPIFFKLHQQAQQTIPEDSEASQHTLPNRTLASPVDPFMNLEPRETKANVRVSMERPQLPPLRSSFGVYPPPMERRQSRPKDPPASLQPKQLFAQKIAEDGFPADPPTTPQDLAVETFFHSQMKADSEWASEWTNFGSSPFGSDSSPNSVRGFKAAILASASEGSKYSI
jgi:hypothetical protein